MMKEAMLQHSFKSKYVEGFATKHIKYTGLDKYEIIIFVWQKNL